MKEEVNEAKISTFSLGYFKPYGCMKSYPIRISYDCTRNLIICQDSQKTYFFKNTGGNVPGLFIDKECLVPFLTQCEKKL